MKDESETNGIKAMSLGMHETLFSLLEISKDLPLVKSTRIHPSTLWRWCRRGFRGIYLDHLCMGRTIVTSHEAVGRFFQAIVEQQMKALQMSARASKRQPRISDAQRKQQLEQAEAILRRARIIT